MRTSPPTFSTLPGTLVKSAAIFGRRETGLQHAAVDVDAAFHETAAARAPSTSIELACEPVIESLPPSNRRAALQGGVARHDQRPGPCLVREAHRGCCRSSAECRPRARIHPFLAPLDGVLISDLVVLPGMAVSNSLDVRITQNALKHERSGFKRAVRVQHVGAEFTSVGNAMLLVARQPLQISSLSLP